MEGDLVGESAKALSTWPPPPASTGGTGSLADASVEDIFSAEPVPLDIFITDRAFLSNPPLSVIQYDLLRHIEQILLPETYCLMEAEFGPAWTPVRFVRFAWTMWGKGSGKDHVCRLAVARTAYLLQCLKDPQAYFAMPGQDSIHILNVAASAQQASRAFFEPLRRLIGTAPCFRDRFESRDGHLPGRSRIVFDKQIEAISGHSGAETLEGLNLLLGIADEISAFRTDQEVDGRVRVSGRSPVRSATGLLKMMRTSASTRFPSSFKIVAISYPRFKGDPIQTLVEQGLEDNARYGSESRVFVSGPFATWDVNPRVASKQPFERDYEEDPAMARAMYECKPEVSTNRFLRNESAVRGAFGARVPDPITIEYVWGTDESVDASHPPTRTVQPREQAGWQVRFHFAEDLVHIAGASYVMHGDISIRGDRAGVALVHVKSWPIRAWPIDDGDPIEEHRPLVKVDFVGSFEADLKAEPAPREVQIRWYRKLVWELVARGFMLSRVTFDRYQSADMMQILSARGIECGIVSTDSSPAVWHTLRDVLYEGRLEGYWRDRLVRELLELNVLPSGRVDHPPGGGSKDEADAVAAALWGAIEVGGREAEDGERARPFTGDAFGMGGHSGRHLLPDFGGFTSIRDLGPSEGGW